jgi:class 3 adenylate cyclase
VWFTPANALGRLALLAGGASWQFHRPFDRVFRQYDERVAAGKSTSPLAKYSRYSPGGAARLATVKGLLLKERGKFSAIIQRLAEFVAEADDLDCQKMRAYTLADRWKTNRRETLRVCLYATRAGMLDFHWDALCPHCRGAKAVANTLSELKSEVHCDTCQLDFTTEFDRSVELTFTPNSAIRRVPRVDYCIGGPQLTPHVVIQQTLPPGETRSVQLDLAPGRYRLRSPRIARPWPLRLDPEGAVGATLRIASEVVVRDEMILTPVATLALANASDVVRQVVIEHIAWSDQATMASEVTSLQLFRDLFAREVLRPGGRISVNSLTIVFTDLKGSTQLYRDIGDAPAFSQVLTHFDVLKSAIDAEGGAIVKTMGDAIMAVFPRPAPALRALFVAQRQLALAQSVVPWSGPPGAAALASPLLLKAAVHHGPCIAINQNDRLDYFGTTVNVAARLCGMSTGADLLLSEVVRADAEISMLLAQQPDRVRTEVEQTRLRGIEGEMFEVYRIRRR